LKQLSVDLGDVLAEHRQMLSEKKNSKVCEKALILCKGVSGRRSSC